MSQISEQEFVNTLVALPDGQEKGWASDQLDNVFADGTDGVVMWLGVNGIDWRYDVEQDTFYFKKETRH